MSEATLGGGRTCGTCTLCCKLPLIDWPTDLPVGRPPLKKPRNTWCQYCNPGHGCTIYEDRPISCAGFQCLWLMGFVPEALRPDVIGGFFDVQGPYLTLLRDPDGKNPLQDPRVTAFIERFTKTRGRRLKVVEQPRPPRSKSPKSPPGGRPPAPPRPPD